MSEESAMSRHARGENDRDAAPAGRDAVLGSGALSVPETDPEQIAFKLWNEGRVDEAIRFLEQEVAAERGRHAAPLTGEAELPMLLPDTVKIEPVSDWRDRHRAALDPATFNAFGAAVHTIELVAEPGDAILPHPSQGRRRAGWIIGIGVAALAVSAAGAFWGGRRWSSRGGCPPLHQTFGSGFAHKHGSHRRHDTSDGERRRPANPYVAATPAKVDPDPTSVQAASLDDVPPPDDEAVPEDGASDAAEPARRHRVVSGCRQPFRRSQRRRPPQATQVRPRRMPRLSPWRGCRGSVRSRHPVS